ncbi:DUF6907 domain-containing protein [Streptomyces sp. NRRL F-5123]|uniref:DUF6907 domain-containing protein n=1 Tax=Streptomyces sp. NRRL F-5123 TaxID=1463856 RepID=UPI0004E17021|nr:hypothetical protein [Streptomyces sp. NRRL F-5123]
MNERTVTINTSDHGPVTIPEPMWCTGHHRDGAHRSDIHHAGVDHVVTVDSPRGRYELLRMALSQWPYGLSAPGNGVYVSVHLPDGDPEYDSAGLEGLAADLLEAAVKVRRMARRVAIESRLGDGR